MQTDGLPPRRDPIDTATLTGLVDLVAPDPATINARALAHGLAMVAFGAALLIYYILARFLITPAMRRLERVMARRLGRA